MEINATLVDLRERRWFGKVARGADATVNDLVREVAGGDSIEIHALFNTTETKQVEIVNRIEGDRNCTQVVYAAGDWKTMSDSIPPAAAQLATALIALAPADVRSELVEILGTRFTLFPVRLSQSEVPSDGRIDFYLWIEEGIELDAFFALMDRIDRNLSQLNAGEVSGNSFGLRGSGACVDLVAADRGQAQKIVEAQVRASGIGHYKFRP